MKRAAGAGRLRVRARLLGATVAAVLALVLVPQIPVAAYQVPTTAVSGTGVATMPGSGLTTTYTATGATTRSGATTLGSRGYVGSDFTPGLSSSTPAVGFSTATATCANTGPCPGLGTITIAFSQPVTNPVLSLAGLGGYAESFVPGTTTALAQSELHAILTLTTPGASLSKLSGGNLQVSDNTITAANDGTSTLCDSTNNTTGNGSGTLPGTATAACGSVQITGTVTSLTFNVSAQFTQTTPSLPPYNAGPTSSVPSSDDYAMVVTAPEDFGDAPASYDQGNAARAVLSDVRLGAGVDEDNATVANGTASPNAGAGASGDAKDDGVTLGPLSAAATSYSTTVTLSGASKAGTVCGWIDFDDNGIFDNPSERACASFAAGATSASLTWSGLSGLTAGTTYARFRIGYNAAETQSPIGASDAGEVEDYPLAISAPGVANSGGAVNHSLTVAAAAGGPFDCSKTGMVWIAASPLDGDTSSQTTALYSAQTSGTGAETFTPVGPTSSVWYNAIGYDQADGYLYGVRREDTQDTHLIQIGQGGVVTDLGAVPGLPSVAGAQYYNQGTMGDAAHGTANTLYLMPSSPNSSSGVNVLYLVKVTAPQSATAVTLSRNVPNLSDIFYLDGYIWGVFGADDVFRIDPTTGQVLEITGAAAAAVPGGSFGGQFVYGNGNIGLVNNGNATTGGGLYQLSVTGANTATPTFSLVSVTTSPTSTNNDATACPGPNVDLGIKKYVSGHDAQNGNPSDWPSYVSGTPITYTLRVHNYGPGDSSGAVVTDPIPSGLTNVAVDSPSTGCTVSASKVTCAIPPMPFGGADFTITLHGTPTPTTGVITNTATVLGNELDPNPNNNSDEANTIASTYDVYLHKVDSSGASLAGSQWTLQADNSGSPGAVVTSGIQTVSASDGLFEMSDLTPGSYWLTETKAPTGFSLLAQPIKFTVAADGTVTLGSGAAGGTATVGTHPGDGLPEISVRDQPALALPLTGGSGNAPLFTLVGVCLVGVALLLVVAPRLRSRRSRKRGER